MKPLGETDQLLQPQKNTLTTYLSRCGQLVLFLLMSITTCIAVLDIVLPSPIDPQPFSLPHPPTLNGVLKQNLDLVSSVEKLYENELLGPESLVVHNDHIYTGTADGQILDIYDGKIHLLATLGKPPCGGYANEPTCGRPLGMRLGKDGKLYVLDAYLGLFKVDTNTGQVEMLLSSEKEIDGQKPRFLNDLDVDDSGAVYFSDSSTKWDRRRFLYLVFENKPLGRVIKYVPKTNKIEVLMDGLGFPNGVQLSKDQNFLLVCELNLARILKYNLKGERSGRVDIFADNLPGLPDNIRPSASGGYWVGLSQIRHQDKLSLYDVFAKYPWPKRFFTKILGIDTIRGMIAKKYGMILELNTHGDIVYSAHDVEGSVVPSASEVQDVNGTLYIGSYHSPFIAKKTL